MDKRGKGNGMGMFGKILLIIALVLTILGGVNAIFVLITRIDLIGRIFLYFPQIFPILAVRITYGLTGLATLVVAVWLFIKVLIKKE
ncbi:Uncharacterised protein [uncultured archaeon]|nr:Uncharacterised protein [uncultured archaeon]